MESKIFYYKSQLALYATFFMSAAYAEKEDKNKMMQYDNDVRTGKIKVLRRGGGLGNNALICYDNLPDAYKVKIQKVVPDPMREAQRNEVEILIEHNEAISDFYSEYEIEDGVKLKADKSREYYNNAIVMVALGKLYNERKSYKKTFKVRQFWKWAAQQVTDLDRSKYPHNLPLNPDRLQDKYNDFFDATQYTNASTSLSNHFPYNLEAVMKLGRFGMKTAAKVKDELQESVLFELLKNNIDDVFACNLYNYKAKQEGWQTITPASVGNWRIKWQMELHAARNGTASFYNEVAMQHKRKRPEFPLYFWSMDGWDFELYYQDTTTDKKGYSRPTYTNRLNTVIVLDACTNYPVGYAIGKRETADLIQEAMRNAIKHVEELFGKKYSPQQLQSDHYGIKRIADLAKKNYTKHYTPAKVGNAKAKPIEPYNKYLLEKYCRLFPNWSGYGVKTSNKKQPNPDILNLNKKGFPDYDGLVRQIEWIMALEREKKQEQYVLLWNMMPEEKRLPMSDEKYLLMFGATNGHRQLLQGNGLILTLNGQKYQYDCFDIEFRRHATTRWEVYFDTEDMSRAVAINEDGTRRFMLEEKYVQSMALAERQDGDSEQLARVNNYNRQLEEHVITFHERMEENVKQVGAPKLIDGLLMEAEKMTTPYKPFKKIKDYDEDFTSYVESDKIMITDGKGQHKENRYAERECAKFMQQVEEPVEENCYDLY